jgi:hypothetical protein
VGILDSTSEEPHSKLRRYIMTGAVFVLLLALAVWWILRFHTEKQIVRQFLDTVVAGDLRKAYEMWKPSSSYSYQDFLADWGPNGEFGPVRTYRIESAQRPNGGSGVVIVVEVSKYEPFPDPKDTGKSRHNKEVRIWIESKDLSMGFAP